MQDFLTKIVRKFLLSGDHIVPDIYGRSFKKLVDIRSNQIFFSIAKEARTDGRTLLYFDRLFTLYQAVENLKNKKETVRLLEIGVYKGGGSYFLAKSAQALFKVPIEQYAVDTFEGHSSKDLPTGKEGGHVPGLFDKTGYEDVLNYLSKFSFIKTIKGRIQDVLSSLPETFDLIHLDVDIYEPTLFSLNYFGKNMHQGGIIIVDDYGFTTCPGIRKAIEQYLEENPETFVRFELLTGQCLLIKLK